MAFDIHYMDLRVLIRAYGHDSPTVEIVADYLNNLEDNFDLSYYIWNTLPWFVKTFKTKEEAEEYIKDNLNCSIEDCTIYVCDKGVYLEWE